MAKQIYSEGKVPSFKDTVKIDLIKSFMEKKNLSETHLRKCVVTV